MEPKAFELGVYADADYADKANDRRSVSGIAVTLGRTVESQSSKTQHVMSLSTSEEGYIAPGDGVKEALFARTNRFYCARDEWGKY